MNHELSQKKSATHNPQSGKSEILLQVNNAHVQYGGVKALNGASIAIDEGELVAVMGPNGAGKSTVLKTIFGLAPMTAGEVRWHGEVIHPVPHQVVRRGIAFVPQGRRVFTHLTVEENLEIGAFVVGHKEEVARRMREVMEVFPVLKEKRHAPSGSLSGGQQQMLAIARGLMVEPKVLLLDEPSLGLSPKLVKEAFAKIKEINVRHKTAIVIVEHNLKSLFEIVDRCYVLDKSKVIADETPEQLQQGDLLEKVFVGAIT